MLVWCMLVVGLNDEMKNQHAQVIVRYALLCFHKWHQSLACNIDLTRYLVLVFCKSYLTNHSAKDGIFGALRLVSCFKGPSLISQHHIANFSPNSYHICRGSKLMNLYDACECAFHMLACIVKFKFNIHAYVVYASCRFE